MNCIICEENVSVFNISKCGHGFCLNCFKNEKIVNEQTNLVKCTLCDFAANEDKISSKFDSTNTNSHNRNILTAKRTQSAKYRTNCQLNFSKEFLPNHFKRNSTSEIRNEEPVVDIIRNPVMCKKHQKIEMDLYCIDCKMVICLRCFALQHTKHEIKDVEEIIKDEKEKINNNLKLLENNLNELNIESENLKKIEAKILNNKENVLQQIAQYSKVLISKINSRVAECETEVSACTNKFILQVKQHVDKNIKSKERLEFLKERYLITLISYSINNLLYKNEVNNNFDAQYTWINTDKLEYHPFVFRFSEMNPKFGELYVKRDMSIQFLKWLPREEMNKCWLLIEKTNDLLYMVNTNYETLTIYSLNMLKRVNLQKIFQNIKIYDCIIIDEYLLISIIDQTHLIKMQLKSFNKISVQHSCFSNSMKLFNKSGNEFYFFRENTSKIGIGLSEYDDSTITLVTMIELNKPILSCLQFNEQLLCCYTEDNKTFQLGRINLETSEVTSVSNLMFDYDCRNHYPPRADTQRKILFINNIKAIHFLNDKFEKVFEYDLKDCYACICIRTNMVCDDKRGRIIISNFDNPNLAILKYDDYKKWSECNEE